MTVKLSQYRWTVSVFNNRKVPLKKTHGQSLQKNILKTHLLDIVIFLIVLSVRYAISLNSAKNIRFLRWSLFHSLYFMSVRLYIHYVWLHSLAIKLSGDIKENPGSNANSCLLVYLPLELKQHQCTQLHKIFSSLCLHLYQQNWYYVFLWNILRLK